MSAHNLISRLDHCRQSGEGRWIARCPAHKDSSPSLSIKEASDGRVLVNCFAGCGALEVITAVGLDWDDMFPPRDEHYPGRRVSAPRETVDSLVVEIAENDRAMGRRLSKPDIERYRDALKRDSKKSDAITEIYYESGALS